jgi:hypothetical protein
VGMAHVHIQHLNGTFFMTLLAKPGDEVCGDGYAEHVAKLGCHCYEKDHRPSPRGHLSFFLFPLS